MRPLEQRINDLKHRFHGTEIGTRYHVYAVDHDDGLAIHNIENDLITTVPIGIAPMVIDILTDLTVEPKYEPNGDNDLNGDTPF